MPEKLSEEDVKRLYITPAIDRAGWWFNLGQKSYWC